MPDWPKFDPPWMMPARSLGYGPTSTLAKVHAPLMGSSLLTAMMLVFVDVMKELPATLVIRPFNFGHPAVRVYQYASDERLVEAAAPALTILLVGIIPVILLRLAHCRQLNTLPPVLKKSQTVPIARLGFL